MRGNRGLRQPRLEFPRLWLLPAKIRDDALTRIAHTSSRSLLVPELHARRSTREGFTGRSVPDRGAGKGETAMAKRLNVGLTFLAMLSFVLGLAGDAQAVDGVVLIDQNRALAGG